MVVTANGGKIELDTRKEMLLSIQEITTIVQTQVQRA
jgi:hypothetical protein